MKHRTRLSYLMVLSWQIQRKKKPTRRQSLHAAWAITLNEDITVYCLVKRHSNRNIQMKTKNNDLALFSFQ
ncbi:MAG: hypothetical protein ACJ748_12985 [Flavisolibacter sp.]